MLSTVFYQSTQVIVISVRPILDNIYFTTDFAASLRIAFILFDFPVHPLCPLPAFSISAESSVSYGVIGKNVDVESAT